MERNNPNSKPPPSTNPSTPPPDILPEMPELKKRPESNSRLNEWKTLLNESFCLGENHQDVAAKKFLIENMQTFRVKGYKVLFMEHLTQKEHQHLINGYFQGDCSAKDMPKDLEGHLRDQDDGQNLLGPDEQYNFAEIVRSAKKAGIRIVCLEKNMADYMVENKGGRNRMKSLNEHTVKLVGEEIKEDHDLKYIAFVGNTHLNEMYGVPGICEVLKVQDLAMFDSSEDRPESFSTSEEKQTYHSEPSMDIKSSMLLVVDPKKSLNLNVNLPNTINKVKSDNTSGKTLSNTLGDKPFEIPPPQKSPELPTAKKAKVEEEEYKGQS